MKPSAGVVRDTYRNGSGMTVVVVSVILLVCRNQSGNSMLKLLVGLSVDQIGAASAYQVRDGPERR